MENQNGVVEVNRATLDELISIPGIGPALAERIIAARPFTSLEDMTRVNGIGTALLERLRPYLIVQPEAQPEPLQAEMTASEPAESGENPQTQPAAVGTVEETQTGGQDQPETLKSSEAAPSPPSPPPAPQPPSTVPAAVKTGGEGEKWARREDLIWMAVGVAILTLILSLIFNLGTLALINQTLSYAPAEEAQVLAARLEALNNRIRLLEGDVDNLRSRVQTIEALGGRITALENGQQSLNDQLQTAQGELDGLKQQTAAFQTQIEELQKRSNVFQNFLDGLRRLLNVGETP